MNCANLLWRSGQNMWFQCMISAQWLLLLQNHWPSVPAWNKESLGLTHFILESTSMFDAVRSYKRRGQYIQSREIIWHKRGILNRASVSQCLKIIFSSDKMKIRHTIYISIIQSREIIWHWRGILNRRRTTASVSFKLMTQISLYLIHWCSNTMTIKHTIY